MHDGEVKDYPEFFCVRKSMIQISMTSLCFKDLGKFSAFVFFLYIMPVGMIWLGVIPFNYRFHLLVAISLMLFLYLYIKNHSLVDLGISLNNFKDRKSVV